MMNLKIRPKDLLKKALSPSAIMFFIIAASFIYILSATWFKWGELIIDTSRELLTPYQVLQGKIIYKDIFYPYGFLPPYFVSIIYRVFGISIGSLAFCGIAITILMSVLLYKIARFFLDEIFSSLTVLTFLFVFAFGFYTGNGIFNYILPYSFASTFFMLFTTFALYFFIKFLLTDNRKYGLCWCIAIVSSLLSRPDLSMLVWAGFFLAGAIRILGAKKRRALAEFLFLTAPVLIGAASYLFYIFMTNSWSGFNDSIISCIRINSTNKLTIAWAGLNDVVSNSLLMTGSFSVQLLIASFLAFSAAAIRPPAREKETGSFRIMSQLLLVFVIFFLARAYVEAFSQYRCMPLLLLLGLAFSIIRMISSKDFKKDLALFTIFLIALLLTLRIFLNTTPYNYGFYLLNLSIVCYYIFFAVILKDLLAERIRFDNNIYLPGLLMFFILLIIPHWQASLNMYANKNVVANTARGAIGCFGSQRSIRFWSAVDYINKNTSGGDSVVVFPEGASLNFFTGRPCSSKYHTFLPPDVETVGEDKMLSELANSDTDYIIILTRDTSEYGYTSFGFDYAKKLYAWIIDNYEVVKQFGPTPNTTSEFGITILRKKLARVHS